jgi:hypothetical protein
VPSRFEVFEVRGELVAGHWLGEYDEDQIRVYRLQPTS